MRGAACAAALAAALVAGCSSVTGTLPAPAHPEPPLVLMAGAARVDLTPPPGYPMGGFSGIGRVGRGHWTRLHARAVHLQSARGAAVVIVSCDLWSMSAGLADRVAERLGSDPVTAHIGRDQLVLAATHTHHSPGNYSSSAAYNALASPQPGFDRALFEHYAERIHHAIALACRRSTAARVRFASVQVPHLARNRSMEAFLQNPEHEAWLASNAHLPCGPASDLYPDPRCYQAIDATVSVLRVDRAYGAHDTLAVLGFAALHPTVLGSQAPVYSSDVFGVAALELERASGRRADADEPRTVVALFNGAEGDVSAAWERQDRNETVRLGRVLADGVRSAWNDAGRADREPSVITHRFGVVPLSNRTFVCEGETVRTTSVAAIGKPALGGAEDGRTPEHDAGCVEGITGHSPAGQSPKRPAFDLQLPAGVNPFVVTRLVDAVLPPPDEVPIGVYEIGGVTLATVPGEATTMLGRRIRDSVGAHPTLLVGLANEYLSYWTTPEEYMLQHYEGASTLWGTYAGALLAYELGRLAHAAPGTYEFSLPLPREFAYRVGLARTFGPRHAPTPSDPSAGLDTLLGAASATRDPSFDWDDVRATIGGTQRHLTPCVSIERYSDLDGWVPLVVHGSPERDDGVGFVTVLVALTSERARWRVWWTPPDDLAPGVPLRFRVRRCDGSVTHSEPFGSADLRPLGTVSSAHTANAAPGS